MQPLGVDYESPKCDQCKGEIDDEESRYECNCGAMLCCKCYGACEVCE